VTRLPGARASTKTHQLSGGGVAVCLEEKKKGDVKFSMALPSKIMKQIEGILVEFKFLISVSLGD
jgi:hypothetical protein